jgi:hypothetical protein
MGVHPRNSKPLMRRILRRKRKLEDKREADSDA